MAPASGHAAHITDYQCRQWVAKADVRVEGHGTASKVRSSQEPGNVACDSLYAHGITAECRRWPALQVEQPILITT